MAEPFTIEFTFRSQRFNDASAGLRAFAAALEKDWDGSAKVLSAELRVYLEQAVEALQKRHGNPWPGGTTENSLSKRSGDLLSAIAGSVRVGGDTFNSVEGSIGAPGVPYGRIHEVGGVIRAKNGKYLTIPLPAALDSRGVALKKSARDWDSTFVARSKAGNLLIFQKRGASIAPLYVLKEEVTIRPRLNMGATLRVGLPYFVDRVVDKIANSVRG